VHQKLSGVFFFANIFLALLYCTYTVYLNAHSRIILHLLHCFKLRCSECRFVRFGVCCVDVITMFACRYFRVTAGRAGTGRWTRTTLLYWQSPRHHSGDHYERYRQTSDIQRQKPTSSSYCCQFQEQVNDVVVTVCTLTTLSSPLMFNTCTCTINYRRQTVLSNLRKTSF